MASAVIPGGLANTKASAMTLRVPLNDGDNWADLKTIPELTGADQDAVFDVYDRLLEAKPQPEPQPDPANPAVMLPAPRPRFSNRDGRDLRDAVLSVVITAWSFDQIPLPYTPEARRQLPLPACNALYEAVDPIQDALLGVKKDEAPKADGPSPGSGGSTVTLQGNTVSLLPAPPEAQ
jgi:hypothetical protein